MLIEIHATASKGGRKGVVVYTVEAGAKSKNRLVLCGVSHDSGPAAWLASSSRMCTCLK
jgi:hypothetical protein